MDDQRVDREGGGVRFRKLRIAWTIILIITCYLLGGLWFMSFIEVGFVPLNDLISIKSQNGSVTFREYEYLYVVRRPGFPIPSLTGPVLWEFKIPYLYPMIAAIFVST